MQKKSSSYQNEGANFTPTKMRPRQATFCQVHELGTEHEDALFDLENYVRHSTKRGILTRRFSDLYVLVLKEADPGETDNTWPYSGDLHGGYVVAGLMLARPSAELTNFAAHVIDWIEARIRGFCFGAMMMEYYHLAAQADEIDDVVLVPREPVIPEYWAKMLKDREELTTKAEFTAFRKTYVDHICLGNNEQAMWDAVGEHFA